MKIAGSLSLVGVLGFCVVSPAPSAQSNNALKLRVRETAGIRRNAYPATTRVHLPKGALSDSSHARLMSDGKAGAPNAAAALGWKEVPAQFGFESSYPDGSAQWLTVDFNVSIGPREQLPFTLEYGGSVKSEVVPRGLMVSED